MREYFTLSQTHIDCRQVGRGLIGALDRHWIATFTRHGWCNIIWSCQFHGWLHLIVHWLHSFVWTCNFLHAVQHLLGRRILWFWFSLKRVKPLSWGIWLCQDTILVSYLCVIPLTHTADPFFLNACIKFLQDLFNQEETADFFFRNDLHVLIDVTVRELTDRPKDDEVGLQHQIELKNCSSFHLIWKSFMAFLSTILFSGSQSTNEMKLKASWARFWTTTLQVKPYTTWLKKLSYVWNENSIWSYLNVPKIWYPRNSGDSCLKNQLLWILFLNLWSILNCFQTSIHHFLAWCYWWTWTWNYCVTL